MVLAALGLSWGCSATLDSLNEGAESAGESAGKVISLPTSAAEGAAGGISGKDSPNPYNR